MARETVFEPQDLTFVKDADADNEYNHIYTGTAFPFIIGARYTVLWGDTEYTATMTCITAEGVTIPYLGYGESPDGEYPFRIMYPPAVATGGEQLTMFSTTEEGESRTVGVYLEDPDLESLDTGELLLNGEVVGFTYYEPYNGYLTGGAATFSLETGKRYVVRWGDCAYVCTAQDLSAVEEGMIGIGNLTAFGYSDNNEPFVIGSNGSEMLLFSTDEIESIYVIIRTLAEEEFEEQVTYYTVASASLKALGNAIRAKNGTADPLEFPDGMVEAINGITTGGGASDDVRYVTFMNGNDVLFVKPVAVGDDCVDVLDKGLLEETPMKESTAQYDYTYSGWSLTDGGDADDAALSAVTEDRTVYAAYTSAVRYYTVTYYDDDGVTVLKTETLAYGSTPSYAPLKQGYNFTSWTPEVTEVTGDVSYVASFEIVSFYDMSWADISAASAAGTAANMFAVGDMKPILVKGTIGTMSINKTMYVFILGFDHNSQYEGSGIHLGTFKMTNTAGTTFYDVAISKHTSSMRGDMYSDGSLMFNMNHWGAITYGGWAGCDLRYDILGSTDVEPSGYGAAVTTDRVGYAPTETCATSPKAKTLMSCLPADLRAVMKPITKYCSKVTNSTGSSTFEYSVDYLPLLSWYEITGTYDASSGFQISGERTYQKQYDYYKAGNPTVKYSCSSLSSKTPWWLRSASSNSYSFGTWYFTDTFQGTSASVDSGLAPILMV